MFQLSISYIQSSVPEGDEKLEKILFARIIDGNFMYERGQSSSTVFPGLSS